MEDNELKSSQLSSGIPNPCKRIVNSLYFSSNCRIIYILLLTCNVLLIVWVILKIVFRQSFTYLFYTLECVLNAILLIDVLLKIWINTCYNYWKKCINHLEFIIIIACTCCTVVSIISKFIKQYSKYK